MADNKKISETKSVNEFVAAFLDDDAYDKSKAKKIEHLCGLAQFAACCYVIKKASKQSHSDLFDTNYAALDTTYSRIAEMCLKLLSIRASQNREVTVGEFKANGATDLFGDKADEFFKDYVASGGVLDRCQSLFGTVYTGRKDANGKSIKDSSATAKQFNDITKNIVDIKKDYNTLLAKVDTQKDGTFSRKDIEEMLDTIRDETTSGWKGVLDDKKSGEKELKKIQGELHNARYELAKATIKAGSVLAATVASVFGAIGGTPLLAVLVIPGYVLSKKFLPGLAKATGRWWRLIEDRAKARRKVKVAVASKEFIIKYAEALERGEKNFRAPLKLRRWIKEADITILKKQAKSAPYSLSFEGSDGKLHESKVERTKSAMVSSRYFSQINDDGLNGGDNLVPSDIKSYLENKINGIDPKTVTYGDMFGVAGDIEKFVQKLPNNAQGDVYDQYAQKLRESLKHLVFQTALEKTDDYENKLKTYFGEDSKIVTVAKESDIGKDLPLQVKQYIDFAGGEQSKLSDVYINKTLEDYIYRRVPEPKLEILTNASSEIKFSSAPDDIKEYICCLKVSESDSALFEIDVSGSTMGIDKTVKTIDDLAKKIGQITDSTVRKECDKLLKEQMKRVSYQKDRDNSKKTYEAITGTGIKGSITITDAMKKIGEMTYENMETYAGADFYVKTTKLVPAEAGAYLRSKAAKKAFDLIDGYANGNMAKFSADLNSLTDYLQKVNQLKFLNEYQKMQLTEKVTPCISEALNRSVKEVSKTFITNFNANTYGNLVSDKYDQHGLFEFLHGSQAESPEAQEVSNKLGYLQRLGTIKENLKFGNGYKMSQTDEANIGKILLMDSNSDFGEVKEREDNDELLNFFRVQIAPSVNYASFAGKTKDDVINTIKDKGQGYSFDKLTTCIKSVEDNMRMDVFDKFAALSALKYKALVDMKECLKGIYVLCPNMSEFNEWLKRADQGKVYYDTIVNLWSSEIMNNIDKALAKVIREAQGLDAKKKEVFSKLTIGRSASDMIKDYQTGGTKGLIEQTQLEPSR